MAKQKTSLSISHPDLARQWHPTKNGELIPDNVTAGTNKKVWWICDKDNEHIWEAKISNRTYNLRGCPYCCNQKILPKQSLVNTNPEMFDLWHPMKNDDINPLEVSAGSNRKYWWKCPNGPDHEWQTEAHRIKNGQRCPVCAGQKVVLSNCLATTDSDIAELWHPTKNEKLTPFDVTARSGKKVWWKCDKGDDHEWKARVADIKAGQRCAICASKKVVLSTCLAVTNPDIAKQWHPTKNGQLTPYDVLPASNKKIWWKCDKGDDHEWKESSAKRTDRNEGCTICSNHKVVLSNCLATTHPNIAKQWHPTRNNDLTPFNVVWGSHKKVWWLCLNDQNHEWESTIKNRAYGTDCPYCTLIPQSKTELEILFDLKLFFKQTNPRGHKVKIDSNLYAVDMFLPPINLIIEFDGSYWHKKKADKDLKKSQELVGGGYHLMRLREVPLRKLLQDDMIVPRVRNTKWIVDRILTFITKTFNVEPDLIEKINAYKEKDELQNTKALNRYIDRVLKEKAEKKVRSRKTGDVRRKA